MCVLYPSKLEHSDRTQKFQVVLEARGRARRPTMGLGPHERESFGFDRSGEGEATAVGGSGEEQ